MGADFGFDVGVFFAVVFVIEATPRDVFVRASMTKPTTPPSERPIAKPNRAKNPNVGQKPTEGLMGAAPVTKIEAMTPTTAPVIMNDHMRGARRMVTSSLAMCLFSQCDKRYKVSQRRTGSRRSNDTAVDGRIPRLVPDRERHERLGVEFDDVGRGASGVPEPLDNLDGTVWWDAHFHRLSGRESRELLKNESHRGGGHVVVRRTVPNRGDGDSATLGVNSGKRHAQHASSGKGSVLS